MSPRVSFVGFFGRAHRPLGVHLAGAAILAATALTMTGGTGHAADLKPRPAAPPAMAAGPSGAEQVGKLLAERTTASDPDVPLPQRDLTPPAPAYAPLTGPQIYGRRDEGSVVLGLKIPIPAERRASE